MRRLLPLLPLLPFVLIAGCSAIRAPRSQPLGRPPTDAELAARPRRAPGSYTERWILRRGGTELVFTLLAEIDGEVRFAALDDFGGVLADSEGRSSRILPARMVEQIHRVVSARYAPGETRPVRVGERVGWASEKALWVGDSIYTQGMRIRGLGPGRFEIEGALRATVSGS